MCALRAHSKVARARPGMHRGIRTGSAALRVRVRPGVCSHANVCSQDATVYTRIWPGRVVDRFHCEYEADNRGLVTVSIALCTRCTRCTLCTSSITTERGRNSCNAGCSRAARAYMAGQRKRDAGGRRRLESIQMLSKEGAGCLLTCGAANGEAARKVVQPGSKPRPRGGGWWHCVRLSRARERAELS
jgi:hypothetical protein